MNIGILGAGKVGGTLGTAWARKGHRIRFGVRRHDSPEIKELLRKIGPLASAGSVEEAASFGEAILLATPWPAAEEVLRGAGDLTGKILLDCMNPLKPGLAGLSIGTTTSAGEMVAQWAPGARVVKIFNTNGSENMGNPNYPLGPATMFYCGDDEGAKLAAAQLASDTGAEPVDAGPLSNARLLEPLAMLWIWLAVFGGMGRNIAFKLIRR